jgi:nucleoside-diphosphate-sugar epimerase
MKIFITGGTGFIGKYVVEELKKNKNNELFLLAKDLKNIKDWGKEVKDFGPEFAIHLAWEGLPDYGAKNSIKNLNYGLNLMDLLAESGCKNVLMAGSCWENLPQPFNAFSAAKIALSQLAREISEENQMNFIWARFFFVYGLGQRETSLIPYLLKCKREGLRPEIKNPSVKNDFIYVGDIARAIAMIIDKKPKSAVYDIGSGKLTTAGEVAKMLFSDLEFSSSQISIQDNPQADISKIKELGWEPQMTIKDYIKSMI